MISKLLPFIILVSCAGAQDAAETAVSTVNSCDYLIKYAIGVKAAVVAKDYSAAVELVDKAYKEAESEHGQPCLENASYLVEEAHKYIASEIQKNGEPN